MPAKCSRGSPAARRLAKPKKEDSFPQNKAVARGRTKAKEKRQPLIIFGIDFGTTYSGIAWTTSESVERIEVISGWDSVEFSAKDKHKTPTVISYESWFKLLLLDNEDLPLHVRGFGQLATTRNLLKLADKTPVEAAADYLRALWQHTQDMLRRELGKRYLEESNFQVVATLPAIWPHYAQVRMKEAIEMAGILDPRPNGTPPLSFISEPEAATLATMEDMAGRLDVEEDDHLVVCDAGGGTVDIITYAIIRTYPMTVKESVKGDGKLSGAVMIDEAFLHALRKMLPPTTWDNLGARAIRKIMHDTWEGEIKPNFNNNDRSWETYIPQSGTVQDRFQPPRLVVKSPNILPAFQPTVTRIEELVNSQIDQFVILVGGFGKSQFLYNCLQSTIGKRVEVLQGAGERPWTAICRGAAIKGLVDNKLSKSIAVVDSRIARLSYGTLYNVLPFEAKEHDPADRVYCDANQRFLAVEQTKWFLTVGDVLDANEPIRSEFWQDLESPGDVVEIELVVSDALQPPKRKDATVTSLCNIRLSRIPGNFQALPSWTNTEGRLYRRLQYELRIVCTGASLDFGIYHKNRRLESRNVSVEFDRVKAS
ncbi:Fc.00g061820.m01.CDS01 [Cosmosporella sp. VM-42]